MDAVHLPGARSSWISKPVKIGEAMAAYSETVLRSKQRGDLRDSSRVKVKSMMGCGAARLSDELFESIEANCDVDNLTVSGELMPMTIDVEQEASAEHSKFRPKPIPEHALRDLKTLQMQQMYVAGAGVNEKMKRQKMSRYLNNNEFAARSEKPPKVNALHIDKEVIVVVRVYRPFKHIDRNPTVPSNAIKYNQEIHLLATSKLSELRDCIKCAADETRMGDVSENPTAPDSNFRRAKEVYKSGFFYINGCFYNDMRRPAECSDYSEVIRTWAAANRKRGIGPFRTALMEETAVKDLEVRLGYPYVYVHQGEHEHLFTFNDIRLMAVDDPQRAADYPNELALGTKRAKVCMVCYMQVAVWVTKDNDRVPEDPYFFCNECFFGFNYTFDGQKLGNFKAFEYVDPNAL